MIRLVIVLLFMIHSGHCLNSSFIFEGDIDCQLERFQYHITVYEDDDVWDDPIGGMQKEYSTRPHKYSIYAHDDGDGNNFYEIYLYIRHNCDEYGQTRVYTKVIGSFPVIDGLIRNRTDLNLNGAGEATKSFWA